MINFYCFLFGRTINIIFLLTNNYLSYQQFVKLFVTQAFSMCIYIYIYEIEFCCLKAPSFFSCHKPSSIVDLNYRSLHEGNHIFFPIQILPVGTGLKARMSKNFLAWITHSPNFMVYPLWSGGAEYPNHMTWWQSCQYLSRSSLNLMKSSIPFFG